jgi:phasin family protein
MATAKAAKTIEMTTDQATQTFQAFTAVGQEKLQEGIERSMTAMSEVGAFSKENVEAFVASATVAAKGFEQISARAATFSKTALENHVAAAKAIMTSKSMQEVAEKQSAYMKSAFEAYVAEATKMTELMTGMSKEVIAPLNERVTAVSTLMQSGVAR